VYESMWDNFLWEFIKVVSHVLNSKQYIDMLIILYISMIKNLLIESDLWMITRCIHENLI